MDFDQLTTFIEIAKLGSFSRAGQKLFRSQPAVSAQVRQLEQEYGEKLFDRGRKSVRLTSAGETLFEYAVRLVNIRGESLRAVADKATTPRGILALGANEATCLYVLPDIFAEYKAIGEAMGFLFVASGPFIRSSYNAKEFSDRFLAMRQAALDQAGDGAIDEAA